MRRLRIVSVLGLVLSQALSAGALQDAKPPVAPRSRVTPDRPTALPEDKELATRLARCSAGYVADIRMKQANHVVSDGKTEKMAAWLWYNAVDLSDGLFATDEMSKRLRELNTLSDDADRAMANHNKTLAEELMKKWTHEVTQDLGEGKKLFAKYQASLNVVITNPDGSFKVGSHK